MQYWSDMSWFGYLAVSMIIMGFALTFTEMEQASMAAVAWGSTALGVELLYQRLDLRHIVGAAALFFYALIIIGVAVHKERKNRNGKQP